MTILYNMYFTIFFFLVSILYRWQQQNLINKKINEYLFTVEPVFKKKCFGAVKF